MDCKIIDFYFRLFLPVFSKFSTMNWYYFCIQKVIKKKYDTETQEGDITNQQPVSHSTCDLIHDVNPMASIKVKIIN